MLGEPDPDSVIADRLSGESPFTSSDFVLDFDLNDERPDAGPPAPAAPAPAASAGQRATGPASIDLSSILGGSGPQEVHGGETIEIDLSDALGELDLGGGGTSGASMDRVLGDLSEDTPRRPGDSAAAHYRQACAHLQAGRVNEAVKAAEQAVRSPRQRFDAATLLARVYRDRGMMQEAIEWFERAAQAQAPSPAAGRDLLYDLGRMLADTGESVRALAVFMELQADAPDFRDVSAQVERLSQKA